MSRVTHIDKAKESLALSSVVPQRTSLQRGDRRGHTTHAWGPKLLGTGTKEEAMVMVACRGVSTKSYSSPSLQACEVLAPSTFLTTDEYN